MTRVSLRSEIIGGVTTFFTMAYIIFVNPSILATEGTGMAFSGVLTATVLLCFSMTLLMGLYAKLPFGVAPGMGINAFFTYTVILNQNVHWTIALGAVFWAGVLFVITSITPLRVSIAQAIPNHLRHAAAAGIGLFLTFIGLKNSGIVIADPVTFVKLGQFSHLTLFSIAGFILALWMMGKKNPLAFLFCIFFVTLLCWLSGDVHLPTSLVSTPDFESVFFKLDIFGALKLALLPTIIGIFFTDLFDSISTFVGVSQASGLTDEKGQPKNLKEGLLVDAFATLGAGLLGTSSGTAYIESAAGIESGGRTGRAAVVTAFCFLPFLFIAPLAAMIPSHATAPILILVGALMFKNLPKFSSRIEDAVPAFLTIVLIPLTFSITQGMTWGFVSHVVLYALQGRQKEISPMMWAIGFTSLGLMILEQQH